MFMFLVIVGAITTLFGIFKLVQRLWREMGYEVLIVRKTTMQATGFQAELEESSWDEIIVVGRFETEVYHRGNCSALTIVKEVPEMHRQPERRLEEKTSSSVTKRLCQEVFGQEPKSRVRGGLSLTGSVDIKVQKSRRTVQRRTV
jgi:hypothetical protein